MEERELLEYQTRDGRSPFREWLDGLADWRTRARIDARPLRVRCGNFGDARAVGRGVYELRVDVGPGYRIDYALDGARVVVLLAGGSKSTQRRDIEKAKAYWADYRGE